MKSLQDFIQQLTNLFNLITDWLLIILGIGLAAKALLAIDLPVARYTVAAVGFLLIALGLWYRHRRLGRRRIEQKR